ncbi:MAG: hypothetical protein FWG67_10075 [Defluviitaleaceae bacterium]|nr:hypothetical protein [Defluviitaleaceae bacterium]
MIKVSQRFKSRHVMIHQAQEEVKKSAWQVTQSFAKKSLIAGAAALTVLSGTVAYANHDVVLTASRPPLLASPRGTATACTRNVNINGVRARVRVRNSNGTTTVRTGEEWSTNIAASGRYLTRGLCFASTPELVGSTRNGTVRAYGERRDSASGRWGFQVVDSRTW